VFDTSNPKEAEEVRTLADKFWLLSASMMCVTAIVYASLVYEDWKIKQNATELVVEEQKND